ncbi:MAG: glycoside-pentoside-hexuronide (GPH):cation symporter [Spirochaetaceae bacterium]|jgi:sugar (glycoside-pentoside-hexuronide) transporter|nr:glycoside-pentoside-hexuronide (GPH):cation symporter [Spirochaetaceae bacterium]
MADVSRQTAGPDNRPALKEIFHTSIPERISYGAYFVGQNIFYLFVMQFLMLFYTDYRFIAPAAVGIIFLVARVWDAVNDPMFGVIVDKSHLKSGKFKPWIAISTFFIPIATIAIFALPEGFSPTAKIGYAAATYILFGMLYTICDVPIFALATAMTNNIQERTTLIAIGRVAATIAMVVLSIMVMPLVMARGWLTAAIILAIIAFLVMLPINIFAKERFVDKNAPAVTLRDIVNYLFHNKYLLIFYLSNIIYNLTNTSMTTGNYVAKYFLGGEHMIPVQMLVFIVPMLIVSIFLPALSKKVDKFHLFVTGLIINIVFSVFGYFAGYRNLTVYFTLGALRGIGGGFSMVMGFMFAADCVEYGNYKTGKRAEGITFSIQTFATKMMGAVSGALGGIALTLVGYDGSLSAPLPEHTARGLWNISLLFPVIGMVLCLPVLFRYKLRDKDVQIMAKCNQNQISREEAERLLSRKY